ncbi:hypothetical protein NCCP2222_34610 [Sporosarcina sp. NCCP-2222]|nr:hypothetical protein NCCP2222_34610 [Sporosarcina sp. NCCP-2222]
MRNEEMKKSKVREIHVQYRCDHCLKCPSDTGKDNKIRKQSTTGPQQNNSCEQ